MIKSNNLKNHQGQAPLPREGRGWASRWTLFITMALMPLFINAQPSAVKNVGKAVFTLTTFKADGSLLASSHGVFVGKNGEAISQLKPFEGAASAVVIDNNGNKMNVVRVLGANDIYDVVKFRVDGKTTPATLASRQEQAGAKVWVVGYAKGSAVPEENSVKSVETFNTSYPYYILSQSAPEANASCPLVNASGEVLALVQPSLTSSDTHATSAQFANSLTVSGLSQTDPVLRRIGIAAALPQDYQQAQIALVMAPQMLDEKKYDELIDDFVAQFPNYADGYQARAQREMLKGMFSEADKDMQTAISKATDKADAHFTYAKLIYDKEVGMKDRPYAAWSLDKVVEEAQKAYDIDHQPLYQHLLYQALFAQEKYQDAYNGFMALTETNFRNPELFYEAAVCKKQMQAPTDEVFALIDSAIVNTDTLRFNEAAPFFMARANIENEIGKYRDAALDYARVEILMNGRMSADFYYMREQVEIKAKLFQQAVADINRAIAIDSQEPMYYAEKSSLLMRVKKPEEAVEAARQCVGIAPDYDEGHLVLGISLIQNGNKSEGIQHLQRAKELGNTQAEDLINKYK